MSGTVIGAKSSGKVFDQNYNAYKTIWTDNKSRPVFLPFNESAGAPTQLTVTTVVDSYTITVADATGLSAGDRIGISPGQGRFFGGVITNVAGNVLTLDSPIDCIAEVGTSVYPISIEMNVNGSATRRIFSVTPPSGSKGMQITRILFSMTTTDPPGYNDFGDILNGLTNGIVLRRVNGDVENYFNVKSNADLQLRMFDLSVLSGEKSFDVNGVAGRLSFGGPEKLGTVIELLPVNGGDTADKLEIIVQDDLSSLLTLRFIAEGHFIDT